MRWKGFEGRVLYRDEFGYFGRVMGIRDIITFSGRTVLEAFREFKISVDEYLELCNARKPPAE